MISNFVGRTTRRQTTLPPPRPESTTSSTTKADTASIRGSKGTHSRSNSVDVAAPPAQAGSSPYGNPQLSSSQSSLASTRNKKRPLLQRALTKVIQPSTSQGSLKDGENGKPLTNGSDLSSELSTTQQKLAEATDQCTALQNRVTLLEKENQETQAQTQQAQEAMTEEKTKLIQSHLAEMETQRKETEELRRSLEDFIRKSIEMEERIEVLTRGVGSVEAQLKDRDELIHQLRAAEGSMSDALHQLEASVYAKDKTIQDLERRNGVFAEKSELLQKQIAEMESRLRDQQQRKGQVEGDGFFSALWKWFSAPH